MNELIKKTKNRESVFMFPRFLFFIDPPMTGGVEEIKKVGTPGYSHLQGRNYYPMAGIPGIPQKRCASTKKINDV